MQKHIYETRVRAISGTKLPEVYKKAFAFYQNIKKKTKRRPYVRSEYFKKDKIFLEAYWQHLHQKAWRDRFRRVRFFPCALELIQNTRFKPDSKENPFDRSQILHRFTGKTPDSELFRVQIKEEKYTKNKWLMSIFPIDNL